MTADKIFCVACPPGVSTRAISWWQGGPDVEDQDPMMWAPLCESCADRLQRLVAAMEKTLRHVPITPDRACTSHACGQPAVIIIVWPGKGPIAYCRHCGDAAWRILEVLGSITEKREFPLDVVPSSRSVSLTGVPVTGR